MAESRADLYRHLEDFLACCYCQERCEQPRSLACLHSFCLKCLQELHQTSDQIGKIICSSCYTDSHVPEGGVENYPGVSVLTIIGEAIDKLKHLKLDEKPQCTDCTQDGEQTVAHALCLDCVDTFCIDCLTSHGQITSSHNLLECDSIKAENISEVLTAMAEKCPKHLEKIEIYCEDCQEMMCASCSVSEHELHKIEELDKTAEIHKEVLESVQGQLADRVLQYEKCLQVIDKTRKDTEADELSRLHKVDQHGEELLNHVKGILQEVKNEIKSETAKTVANLDSLHDSILHELTRLKNSVNHIAASIKNGNKLVMVNTSIKEKPAYEKMLHDLRPKHALPKQTIDLQLIDVKDLKRETIIGETQFKTQCEPLDDAAEIPTQDLSSLVPVQAGDLVVRKIRQFEVPYYPSGIACMPGGETVVCANRGSQVSVFRQDGSRRVNLQVPEDTTATDVAYADDNILVADCTTESILVFSSEGSYQGAIPVGFSGGAGICIHDQKLFVTTFNGSTTVSLDWPSGENKQTFVEDAANNNMQRPHFVAANKTSVAMSCYDNKTVHVYDRAARFKFAYKGHGSTLGSLGSAYGVVMDSMGNILISDTENHCVHVVSSQGQCVGQIYLDKDGLKKPLGLAINSRGQLVVSANGSKAVGVYQYRFK